MAQASSVEGKLHHTGGPHHAATGQPTGTPACLSSQQTALCQEQPETKRSGDREKVENQEGTGDVWPSQEKVRGALEGERRLG